MKIEIIESTKIDDAYDLQCALMSLPLHMKTDLLSIPDKVPYLAAEEKLVDRWKARIGEHGLKIGIVWQGNPKNPIDQGRSVPLVEFLPLSDLPGVRLISLQKYHGLDQLSRLQPHCKIETLGDDFESGPDAFVDTAAVMASLDLIITSDTAIAHLAGALGRPTWLALRHVPDWRWMLDREDSPWYPTMRLFRQSERGDWKSVFTAIERELRSLVDVQKGRATMSAKSEVVDRNAQITIEDHDPLEQIRGRIEAGDVSSAIEQLRSLIGKGVAAPDVHRLLAFAHLKDGAFDAAIAALTDARTVHTTSAAEVGFGRFLNGKGYKEAALNCFLSAAELDPENADALALVCKLFSELGQSEEAVPSGQRSLEARDRQAAQQPVEAIRSARPKPFDPSSPNQNIISFSLFGDKPYYWDSAIAIGSQWHWDLSGVAMSFLFDPNARRCGNHCFACAANCYFATEF